MDLLRSADQVNLASGQTQKRFGQEIKTLSSGLRVTDASVDPSGLAIAETQAGVVKGLQAGELDVTNGVNALQTAEGALQTVSALLQRMRTLVVAANSDLRSAANQQATQAEIDQLKLEVNRIGTDTTFNGRPLFDGSLSARQGRPAKAVEIDPQPAPGGNGLINKTVANADALGNPGPLITNATLGNNITSSIVEFTVTGFDQNAIDPVLGPVGPGDYVHVVAYGDDPSFGPLVDSITAVPINSGQISASINDGNNVQSILQFTLANLTAADVGASQAFATYQNVAPATGRPAEINVGRAEGDLITADVPAISTQALGINNITVVAPLVTDTVPGDPVVQSASNQVAARSALVRLDAAIESLGNDRAQIGAETIALTTANQNSAIDEVNTKASESAVRDANIGQESTNFTRDQLLVGIQTNVLRSINIDAAQVAKLLDDSITSFHP